MSGKHQKPGHKAEAVSQNFYVCRGQHAAIIQISYLNTAPMGADTEINPPANKKKW